MLLAPGLDPRCSGQIGRKLVRGKRLHVEPDEAEGGHSQVQGSVRSIDQHGHTDGIALVLTNDLQGLLNPTSLGDDIFDDQDPFPRGDLESATQNQTAFLFLGKEEAAAKLPRDFLSDHQPTHGGGNDGLDPEVFRLGNKGGTELLDDRHLLERLGTLEELSGMQAAPQDEMPFQKGSGLTEEIECFCVRHALSLRGFSRVDQSESRQPPLPRSSTNRGPVLF